VNVDHDDADAAPINEHIEHIGAGDSLDDFGTHPQQNFANPRDHVWIVISNEDAWRFHGSSRRGKVQKEGA